MLRSAEARELEDDLASVDASIGDLIRGSETKVMARKTFDIVPSLVTEKAIRRWRGRGTSPLGGASFYQRGKLYLRCRRVTLWYSETTSPVAFACPPSPSWVLEAFQLQLHHLTPNGFLSLSKFCWACESYGAAPNLDTLCTYYELQKQPKKVKMNGEEFFA